LATFTKAIDIQRRMDKRIATHVRSMGDAHKELWRGGVQDHAQLTSGRVSTDTLRDMGHPFGRKDGAGSESGIRGIAKGKHSLNDFQKRKGNTIRKGVLARLPINKQTGNLRRSFFNTPEIGADKTVDMGFDIPYARHVLSPTGTSRMVNREFYSSPGGLGEIAKRHKARKQSILVAARKKHLFP
jgi:hypothetical protein